VFDIIIMEPRALDFNYLAVINRARALGYTLPTPGQRRKQNQLIRALKHNGIWSKLDVFYALANNGSKEFATIDWVTPSTHQITIVNSCTWAANVGFTGNATDMYLDTNYNPSTMGIQYTQDNAGRFAWVVTDGGAGAIDGTASAGNTNGTLSANSTGQRINQGSTVLSAAADLQGTGLKAINRTSSTNVEVFSGTTQSSRTATSAALTNSNQMILRGNTTYGNHAVSLYGMGASLVTQNTALNDILDTYMASL
jgi:hypothetical protein